MVNSKQEVFMKQRVLNAIQGVLLAAMVVTIIFVEVASLSSASKVLRAEKNYKTMQVM